MTRAHVPRQVATVKLLPSTRVIYDADSSSGHRPNAGRGSFVAAAGAGLLIFEFANLSRSSSWLPFGRDRSTSRIRFSLRLRRTHRFVAPGLVPSDAGGSATPQRGRDGLGREEAAVSQQLAQPADGIPAAECHDEDAFTVPAGWRNLVPASSPATAPQPARPEGTKMAGVDSGDYDDAPIAWQRVMGAPAVVEGGGSGRAVIQ